MTESQGEWVQVGSRTDWVPTAQPPSPGGPGRWHVVTDGPTSRWEWHPAPKRRALTRRDLAILALPAAAVIGSGVLLGVGFADSDGPPSAVANAREFAGGGREGALKRTIQGWWDALAAGRVRQNPRDDRKRPTAAGAMGRFVGWRWWVRPPRTSPST